MLIKEALEKGNNNFNLLRIVLSSLVIIYHSFAIFGGNIYVDPIKNYFHVVSTGGIAVKGFFFLSGMLVTNSLSKSSSPIIFLKSRVKRIFPAYCFLILISCFLIGPIISILPMHEYFHDQGLWSYLFNNLQLNTAYFLPGVFEGSKYAFNGSIWTIPMEVKCYIVLLAISVACRLTSNKVAPVISLIVIFLPFTQLRDWLFLSNDDPAIYMLAPCFSLGCLFSLCKDYPVPPLPIPMFLIITSYFIGDFIIKSYILCFSFCVLILCIFSSKESLKFNIKNDPSYGMYLWSFPLQQIISFHITNNIFIGCLLSLVSSFIVGVLSWKYIEKPFMKNKRAI